MPELSTLLTTALVGGVAIQLLRIAHTTATDDRSEYRRVTERLRWWMLPAALAHLTLVVLAFVIASQVPFLSWGWYTMVTGQPGNALAGQTGQPGAGFVAASFVIPLLLVAVMPRLALVEEEAFRSGNHRRCWPVRLGRAVVFGFVHCLAGVSLATGAALVVSGLYYDAVYQRTYRRTPQPDRTGVTDLSDADFDAHVASRPQQVATYTAAAAHTVSNWLVLGTVLLAVTVTTLV